MRLREMLAAGVESVCDVVAVHVYDRDIVPALGDLLRGPVAVTETGVRDSAAHLDWVLEVYPILHRHLPQLREIHFFVLADLAPGGFPVLDLEETAEGIASRVVSPALHARWSDRVREATGGTAHATFEELVPSLVPYLPTEDDFRRVQGI